MTKKEQGEPKIIKFVKGALAFPVALVPGGYHELAYTAVSFAQLVNNVEEIDQPILIAVAPEVAEQAGIFPNDINIYTQDQLVNAYGNLQQQSLEEQAKAIGRKEQRMSIVTAAGSPPPPEMGNLDALLSFYRYFFLRDQGGQYHPYYYINDECIVSAEGELPESVTQAMPQEDALSALTAGRVYHDYVKPEVAPSPYRVYSYQGAFSPDTKPPSGE